MADTDTRLHFLTIRDASELIRRRELSPVELTRAFLERIDATDGQLHSFITLLREESLGQARTAEAEILSGGYNVYPRLVEEAVYLHGAVEEVAVCGVPDPHRGEIVKAFVHLRDGENLTAGELRAFLKDKLASFEIPRRIEFRGTLPKTLIGKISKLELVSPVSAEAPADEAN